MYSNSVASFIHYKHLSDLTIIVSKALWVRSVVKIIQSVAHPLQSATQIPINNNINTQISNNWHIKCSNSRLNTK
jgi:hypothetical protein